MPKKNTPDTHGFVYSTDPNFRFAEQDEPALETLPAEQQKLKVRLDTKQRAGKAVTLIENFIGEAVALDELGKKLKNFCGTGGSVKDNAIIIQGDQREKIMQWLLKNNYRQTKKV